jgi:hypothetical protein
MTVVYMTQKNWNTVREILAKENPKSVMLISTKMRDHLGFSVREHRHWENVDGRYRFTEENIALDFYSEKKYTMFLLRFSEFMSKNPHQIAGVARAH